MATVSPQNVKMAEVRKEEYSSVSGTSYPDEKQVGVITSQPVESSGIENYVVNLDAAQVGGIYLFFFFFLHFLLFIILSLYLVLIMLTKVIV